MPPPRFPGDAALLYEFSYDIPGTATSGVLRAFSPSPSAAFFLPAGLDGPGGAVVRVRARVMSADGTISDGYAVRNVSVVRPVLSTDALIATAQAAQLAIQQGGIEQGAVQLMTFFGEAKVLDFTS